ncbi:hypothetical protein D9Q61_21895 [Salmonella enterica subsp. enterica serovar Enteritidis]|nr:hypothetical protein [Salmonella enterica subsp. enterica serovar Enteritidis]EDA2251936.1 hypothetical protein [Salmonella enterica subsp. enterica serovar Enteritidis]EDD6151571.1 hypothetical protein [Salmonella enterica subsp. enterica serovar Enteritidis]EDG1208957.1 hypothetical protein [Salmonella enterica subsp. enterica serovar Newport]
MNTKMLNSTEELTQATVALFGIFAPHIPMTVYNYMEEYVFAYRYKGFAIKEIEDGHEYFLPLHIERISMITPMDKNLLDVTPDALGVLLTLHCYSQCIKSDLSALSEENRVNASNQIAVFKEKRAYLLDYAINTFSPEYFVMLLK